jgi:hypothetical protein
MISLSDAQLKIVMAAASHVPIEKRDLFLRRTASMLELRCGRRRRYVIATLRKFRSVPSSGWCMSMSPRRDYRIFASTASV